MTGIIQILSSAQANALIWVERRCPTWPGPPHMTMKALERRGLCQPESGSKKPPYSMTREGTRALSYYRNSRARHTVVEDDEED